jgi:asparagine synthase (glutamine-hydrolysing)
LVGDGIVFGSEIQALLLNNDVSRDIDLQALDNYLSFSYVPAPLTIFKQIRKLPPGHFMICENGHVRIECYWRLDFGRKTTLDETEAAEQIRELLTDSVRLRLMSDVPLGAFLSGGIDSSAIVAAMSQISADPVRTYAVGFEDNDVENHELPYARQVAERYGTQHKEIWVRPDIAQALNKLVNHYGEPFADGSAIPTYYISKEAREDVKVVLSGDGGDELFGGYSWYSAFDNFSTVNQARLSFDEGFRKAASHLREGRLRPTAGAIKGIGSWWGHLARMKRDPVRRFGQLTSFNYWGPLRRQIYSEEIWPTISEFNPLDHYYTKYQGSEKWGELDRIFYLDHHSYLPDDILVKVDIASMACSLETRPPFLDHRLVEFAASLPTDYKLRNGQTKLILRKAVANWLPSEVLNKKKVGFGPPISRWIRNQLNELATDYLRSQTFRDRGLFNEATVNSMLRDHGAKTADYGVPIYSLLVFEMWARNNIDSLRASSNY